MPARKPLTHQNEEPRSTIVITSDSQIFVQLDAAEFVESRGSIDIELTTMAYHYYEYLGKPTNAVEVLDLWGSADFVTFLEGYPNGRLRDLLFIECKSKNGLIGAGDNGLLFVHEADADPHNLLDRPLAHLTFRLGAHWYALACLGKEADDFDPPTGLRLEDETRMFENENALILPRGLKHPRFEFHQGTWYTLTKYGEETPLDQYEIVRRKSLRGTGVLAWDGEHAYCPVTGKPLVAYPYDRTMKRK